MKDCFLGLYWGNRKETVDECAQKLFETFTYLSTVGNSFKEWYRTSKPKKGEVIPPIDLSIDEIKNHLLNGRSYNDDGTLNEDLGFSTYLKSLRDFSKSHVLSITCGCFSKRVGNNIVLNMSKADEYNYLLSRSKLLSIYRKLVEIWSPERGIIKCQDENVSILSESYN